MGALMRRSRPPPRVHRKLQPCLGALAPAGLCKNSSVPLPRTGVFRTCLVPVPSRPSATGPQRRIIHLSVQKREDRYVYGGSARRGRFLIRFWDTPPISFTDLLFISFRIGSHPSEARRWTVECREEKMPEPPAGERGWCAPQDVSLFAPAGRREGTVNRRAILDGGHTRIALRATLLPHIYGVEDSNGRGGSSLMPNDPWSAGCVPISNAGRSYAGPERAPSTFGVGRTSFGRSWDQQIPNEATPLSALPF